MLTCTCNICICKDVAERCLAANNWALFREFMAGSAAAPVVEQYIQQLQQPGDRSGD
jgi:hypothetical protein